MTKKLLHNPHVGEILKEEFIAHIGISQNSLAKSIKVPANRIHHIINGKRRITADTDIRLCRFFDVSEGYFLRLQSQYEIMEAKRAIKDNLKRYSYLQKPIIKTPSLWKMIGRSTMNCNIYKNYIIYIMENNKLG